jgi:hypothetical protein
LRNKRLAAFVSRRLWTELWPKLGDGCLRRAAYRGGWKPA